jgi:hypothetical protein
VLVGRRELPACREVRSAVGVGKQRRVRVGSSSLASSSFAHRATVAQLDCTLPASRLSSNEPLLFCELVLVLAKQAASVAVFFRELRWNDIEEFRVVHVTRSAGFEIVVQSDVPIFAQCSPVVGFSSFCLLRNLRDGTARR